MLHVLNDSIHNIDRAHECITAASTDPVTGVDFSRGTFGVPHDAYMKGYVAQASRVGKIDYSSLPELYEAVMCLAYP